MKKISIVLVLLMNIANFYSQVSIKKESVNNEEVNSSLYRLYPTQNIWNFIKLNTSNGQMWQLQFDIGSKSGFETNLNSTSLVPNDKEITGRFILYPTQNIWTFILLDQIDGNTWKVQWATEVENRWIIPVN
ncbi:hypothetical protein [Kaistella sp.]|uniref:hypothetical protein n=1 Tax=Kaistella sp. TaxID=2782235 RepID=UPI0035A003BB